MATVTFDHVTKRFSADVQAVNDLNLDGQAEIITGAGAGGGPNLRVYHGTQLEPTLLADTMPLDPAFRGGIFVG